jgi:hypothetical protein
MTDRDVVDAEWAPWSRAALGSESAGPLQRARVERMLNEVRQAIGAAANLARRLP